MGGRSESSSGDGIKVGRFCGATAASLETVTGFRAAVTGEPALSVD